MRSAHLRHRRHLLQLDKISRVLIEPASDSHVAAVTFFCRRDSTGGCPEIQFYTTSVAIVARLCFCLVGNQEDLSPSCMPWGSSGTSQPSLEYTTSCVGCSSHAQGRSRVRGQGTNLLSSVTESESPPNLISCFLPPPPRLSLDPPQHLE